MTQPVTEPSDSRVLGGLEYRTRQLARRPPLTNLGTAIYAIEVFENDTPLVAGDEAFEWEVPEDLDGAVLTKIEGYVNTVSSSGTVQVQIANEREAGGVVDMLSTKLTIDVGDLNSKDSSTPVVIDTDEDDVVWGDHLRIDVDQIGTGVLGLGVILYFTPAATKTLVIEGSKGDPGGIVNWTGAWQTATGYSTGDAVSHNGSAYVARQDHTSGASSEPGVGVDWEDYWMVLFDGQQYTALTVNVTGGGYALDDGLHAIVEVPFACTIAGWTVLADQVGTVEFDIRKDSYANYPPLSGDSIVASDPPQLISAQKATSTALTGWTTSIAAGDTLHFVIMPTPAFVSIVSLTLNLARI